MRTTMKTDCRPFRLSDAMILIAALGLGMGWLSYNIRSEPVSNVFRLNFSTPRSFAVTVSVDIANCAPPFLVLLTPTALAIGLRHPHPPRRWLWRRPGQVACLIALAITALDVAIRIIDAINGHGNLHDPDPLSRWVLDALMDQLMLHPGLGVLVAWITLGMTGVWRPSSCWIDRLGRTVGSAWIAVYAAEVAYAYLIPR
jgi:hypothetical protein